MGKMYNGILYSNEKWTGITFGKNNQKHNIK